MQNTDPALDEIKQTFERIDGNGDRHIDFQEFSSIMLEIDHTRSERALRALFDGIGVKNDGRVTFEAFREWCSAGR